MTTLSDEDFNIMYNEFDECTKEQLISQLIGMYVYSNGLNSKLKFYKKEYLKLKENEIVKSNETLYNSLKNETDIVYEKIDVNLPAEMKKSVFEEFKQSKSKRMKTEDD